MPQTFVDHAELFWRLAASGQSQEQIAATLKWSRGQVAQYSRLSGIDQKAWTLVVTTFDSDCNNIQAESVTENVTNVTKSPFNEGILRSIVSLWSTTQGEKFALPMLHMCHITDALLK